jgi:hypothetical protein
MLRIPSDASSLDGPAGGQCTGEDPLAGCSGDTLPPSEARASSARRPMMAGGRPSGPWPPSGSAGVVGAASTLGVMLRAEPACCVTWRHAHGIGAVLT